MFMELVGSTLLLALVPSTEAFADTTPRPLPISAHNCYAENRTDNPRLTEALKLGIDNIEIDLGWDDVAKQLIVGHDAKPRPAIAYPRLETSLIPALESHLKVSRPDGTPTVLTIDWKTGRPEAVRQFKELLDAHAEWFSSAPKAADSPFTTRRLTVCFSGSDAAKNAYDANGIKPALNSIDLSPCREQGPPCTMVFSHRTMGQEALRCIDGFLPPSTPSDKTSLPGSPATSSSRRAAYPATPGLITAF
jgi:hypothetical protein